MAGHSDLSDGTSDVFVSILAGGSGTRLWPYSRRHSPKHLLPLFNGRSTIQLTVDRIRPMLPADHIYIVTARDHVAQIKEQLPSIPQSNYIVEPAPRGTAACCGLAALYMHQRESEAVMISLHADHVIEKQEAFRAILRSAVAEARKGHFVTLGIVARHPDTGFGYIHRGELLQETEGSPVYSVLRFTEKPDLSSAEAFVASGEYYWNSGMFIWRAKDLLSEMQRLRPDIYADLALLDAALGTADEQQAIEQTWPHIRKETVDVAILEQARDVVVIPSEIGWHDIGSWNALSDIMDTDKAGNLLLGRGGHCGIDTVNSLVYSSGRLVTTIGLEEVIVVDTADVVLVCPMNRAQDVRRLVQKLREQGRQGLT